MSLTISVNEIVERETDALLAIHPSWGRVPLGDVAEVTNGFPFQSKLFNGTGDGRPLVRIRNVVGGDTDTYTTERFDERYVVRAGDLLVGMDGDFNTARWSGPDSLLNQRVCKVEVTSDRYEARFLDHVLPGYLAAIHRNTSSVTVKHLSSKSIQSIPLPLPPLAEQRQIADKVDELFSDLDAGEAALRDARRRLVRYRQSVLNAAVTGTLTEAWREAHPDADPAVLLLDRILAERRRQWETDSLAKYAAKGARPPKSWGDRYTPPADPEVSGLPPLPDDWTWTSPEQVESPEPYSLSIGPFGSNLKVEDYLDEGIPLVFVRNIRRGVYDGSGTRYVSPQKAAELAAHSVSGGDILITKMGAPPGDADLYPVSQPDAIITADCVKWRVSALLPSRLYFVHATNSPLMAEQIQRITSGVAQQKISLTRFRTLAYPLPPEAEQAAIVDEVERRLSVADTVAADVDAQLLRSKRLRRSILQRAFEGRLVPHQAPAPETPPLPGAVFGRQTTLAL